MAAPHVTCPSAEDLRAFGLGERMDPAAADEVARHLEACTACADAVVGLTADGFLDRRRAAARPDGTPVPPGPLDGLARSITQPKSPPPDPGADALPTDVTAGTDYELVRELGRGGMGVVYLARHRLTGRDEVLKVMGEGVTARPGAADRFRREIQSAARLDHRNIVRAYSAWQSGTRLVLAMEYVPGNDLAALVKARGPLPVLNACYYAHQVALGLQHAHEHGMVHRDIKPANLIFHRSGKRHTVKILDFGLAKVTSEAGPGAELTGSGQMMGTPLYMAPEQARDAAAADIRADIFSLGCTLYYLLAGAPPHADGVLAVLAGERPKPLPAVRPEVSAELAAVVARMMAKEPDHRYQTPAEAAAALVPFLKPDQPQAGVPTAVPQTTAAGPPEAPPSALTTAPTDPWGELTMSEPTAAPAEPAAPPRRPRWQVWTAVAVGGLACALLAVAAGGGLRVRTSVGTIVVENLPPDADVLVEGETVTLSRKGDEATVTINRGGPHRLKVLQGGKEILSSDVTVTLGGEPVRVRVLPTPRPPVSTDPRGRATPPDAARLARTRSGVREAYKADLLRTKADDRIRLAKTLLERAGTPSTEPTDLRYALLDLAGEVAADAGDFGTALAICAEIDKQFAVDPVRVKSDLLTAASFRLLARGEAASLENLAETAVTVGFEAMGVDRHADAKALAKVAGVAAARAAAPHFVYQAAFLDDEATRVGVWFEQVKGAMAAVERRPPDPRAAAEAGTFHCLGKNDWGRGLALLSACDDAALVALAEREIRKPTTAADQAALGDLWWEAAGKAPAGADLQFRRRARHWYLKALGGMPPAERAPLVTRLVPRIDSVPTRPVTLRIRFHNVYGRHTVRVTSDGVSHHCSHGVGGSQVRVNHLPVPLKGPGAHTNLENFGSTRLLPDGSEFTDADVVREWVHRWGAIVLRFGPDGFEAQALNSTANSGVGAELVVTFQGSGFSSPTRLSGLWEVRSYRLGNLSGQAPPPNWDQIIASPPLTRVVCDRIDFSACQPKPTSSGRQAPPFEGLPHDWFGLVAESEWVTPAGRYEARVLADDGCRVFIDNELVLDRWGTGPGESRGNVSLPQGRHRVRVEYFQVTGLARLQFALRRVGD